MEPLKIMYTPIVATQAVMFAVLREQQHTPTTTTAIQIAMFAVLQEQQRTPMVPIRTTMIATGELVQFATPQ